MRPSSAPKQGLGVASSSSTGGYVSRRLRQISPPLRSLLCPVLVPVRPQAVMDDTFDIAEEFLQDELKKPKYRGRAGTTIEYEAKWGRDFPSFAWWGARVDAHVFAAIAAGQSMTVRNFSESRLAALESYGHSTSDMT